MTSPALRKLVEESAVPILTERINSLQTTVHNLQSMMFKLEHDFQGYIKVTKGLAEELQRELHIRSTYRPTQDGVKKKYPRHPEAVQERWLEWKREHENGKPINWIAREWQVDHETIRYAKSQGFLASTNRKKTKKEDTNHATNNSNTTDGRSSRPVWRGNQPTEHGGQSKKRRLSSLQA